MTYTINNIDITNEVGDAAIIYTLEAGAVAISANDTPDLWAEMLDSTAPVRSWQEIAAGLERTRIANISVERRKFAKACYQTEIISFQDSIEWATKQKTPQALTDALNQITDEGEKEDAIYAVATADNFARSSQTTIKLGELLGKTTQQMDDLFILAATIG